MKLKKKTKHKAELNQKDIEISSLAAQVAKLDRALEDPTHKLEVAKRTIDRINSSTLKEKQTSVSLTTNSAANMHASSNEKPYPVNSNSSKLTKCNNEIVAYKQHHLHSEVSQGDEECKSLKSRTSHAQKWTKHYHELVAYKKQHGHFNVPMNDKYQSLRRWVGRNRYEFRKGKLSKDRVAKLKKIGFFEGKQSESTLHDQKWTNHYHELGCLRKTAWAF